MSKNRIEPVVITSVSADHPLHPHIRPEGTAAAMVWGSATPTAIRYLGEAWPIKGVTLRDGRSFGVPTTPIRFTRTDHDGARETLTLVVLPSPLTLHCDALDREERYAVLVEQGTGDACLCDLDGARLPSHVFVARYCAPATSAPEDVIEQIVSGWETGTTTVERVTEVGPTGATHVLTPEEHASLATPTDEQRAEQIAAARDYLGRVGPR